MKSIDSLLDRFCLNHPKLGIPNLMLYISIGNVVVLLLDMFSQYTFSFWLRLIPGAVFQGQIWRLVTFLFVPVNENLLWFVITVLLYYSIGTSLERTWGTTKFTVYYLLGAAMNLVVGLVMGLLGFAWMETANMYYLNMSLFLAYATLYPDAAFTLYFIIPVKAKWLAWADGVFLALAVVRSLLDRNIPMALMPILAVLNYLLFFWSDLMELLNRGQPPDGEFQAGHPAGAAAEGIHPQMRRLRQDGHGISRRGVPLLLQVQRVLLLLHGAPERPCAYQVTASSRQRAGDKRTDRRSGARKGPLTSVFWKTAVAKSAGIRYT